MNHWDDKFDSNDYIYGKEANAFVQNTFQTPTTKHEKVVLLAEGEGRNAIYLAKLGYDVTTYDMSRVGINKQYKLAEEYNVNIEAIYGDITRTDLIPQASFDYSINIFGHVPNEGKHGVFNNLIQPLVTGGHSYFEFYSTEQLTFGTGGPKDESMLYDINEIKSYLSHLPVKIHKLEKMKLTAMKGLNIQAQALLFKGI